MGQQVQRLRGGILKMRVREDTNSEGDVEGLEPLPLADMLDDLEKRAGSQVFADAEDACQQAAEVNALQQRPACLLVGSL
jgi:hypothetical protein